MNHHRRQHAAAAIHRRQSGFDPDAYLSRLNDGDPFTNIFPTLPTIDIFPTPRTRERETDSSTLVILPTLTLPSTTDGSSTSTSSTSSSTPTTSSSSTTSTSTTVVQPNPTPTSSSQVQVPTTPAPAPTTSSKSVVLVTSTSSITAAAASVSPSDTAVSSSSGPSTGAVVGGLFAGLIAIAAIAVGTMYFLRRKKRQEERLAGTAPFDQGDFRRSAALLTDPPTHADTVARGFNPPPQMMQRDAASPAPTFGTQYGRPGYIQEDSYGSPQYAQYPQYADSPMSANYGANQSYPSFTPGEVIAPHPIYTPQSPHEQYSAAPAAPYPILTRQSSASSAASGGPFATPAPSVRGQVNNVTSPDTRRESPPTGDYVDLSRSSVSPYQAAQYVEISRRLNSEVPSGLASAALERELPPLPPQLPNADASPFADPASAPPTPGAQYAIDRRGMENYVPAPVLAAAGLPHRASTDSLDTNEAEQTLDFPAPPMPMAPPPAAATRYRIDSMPPMLPELNVPRASVGSLSPTFGPMHIGDRDSAMLNASQSHFPVTPSPLASTFGMPASPAPAATSSTAVPHTPSPLSQPAPMSAASEASFIQAPPTPRPAPAVPSDPKNRQTTFSMYDPEDAYGGI